jgi:hypothetical protein
MITKIGLAAGDIWKLLDDKGQLELSNVIKDVPHCEELTWMALGWLCREGHVLIMNQDNKMFVKLRSQR